MDNSTHMPRRAFIKAIPAAGAALALPATAQSEIETPILKLFREYSDFMDAGMTHVPVATGKGEDEEIERLFYSKFDRIKADMMALPCTCAADFAAKVIVDTCRGGLFSDWETGGIWAEARELTGCAS
jgi:hypothetical protein